MGVARASRELVRDELLLRGRDPARWPNAALARESLGIAGAQTLTAPDRFDPLDGLSAREARYRAELARGDFDLPPGWPQFSQTTTPEEASAT